MLIVVVLGVVIFFVMTCLVVIVTMISHSVVTIIVMSMVAMMTVSRCKKRLFGVVPCHVSQHTVFYVAPHKSLFAEGNGILFRVDSPAHVSSEKQRPVIPDLQVFIEMELKKFFGRSTAVH
jgi:hypothetical protein